MTLHGRGAREREDLEAQDSSARLSSCLRSLEERHRARFQGSCPFGFRRACYGLDIEALLNEQVLLKGAASVGSKVLGNR